MMQIVENFDNYDRFPRANYKVTVFTPAYNREHTLPLIGELTFHDAVGFERFNPSEYNNKFGEWIDLPMVGK